jgi:4'-phosphopantetheinyl transferase
MSLPLQTPADSPFRIDTGDVHVWRGSLEEEERARELKPLLSPDEIERANRFRFPEHRRRFVVARGTLRQLLSRYLGVEAREVTFAYSEEGKPSLHPRHASDLFFNVSHSEDVAAFSFTVAREIGVDVEMIRHDVDVDEIPRRFFSSAEQEGLAGLHGAEKYQGFFNCWTRKEAYVKAVGSGLSLPLRDFDVSLLPGEPARLLATRPDPEVAQRWQMASLDFGQSCAAAVVVEGAIAHIQARDFVPF